MSEDYTAQALAARAALLARPAAPVPHIAVIGDSKVAPDSNIGNRVTPVTSTSVLKGANGYMAWALALCGQRARMPAESNVWAFPGMETGTILANLPAFLAAMPHAPGAVVVDCGTNNILHGTATSSFAAITADWLQIAQLLAARGMRCLFVPILPRDPVQGGGTAFTPAQYDVLDRCNRWLHTLAARSGGWIAVASGCLVDLTNPLGEGAKPKANMTVDGTHPGVLGAYYVGKAIAAILRQWYPPIDLLPTSNMKCQPGAPNGNMLLNPMMVSGTGYGTGTLVAATGGASLTGTVADAWTLDMSPTSGLSCVASLVTNASGQPMQQLAFGGGYTISGAGTYTYAQYARLYQGVSSAALSSLAAGDTIEALMAFEIDAGNSMISFPSLLMRWQGSTNYNADLASAQRDLPGEAISGVMRTPMHTLTAPPAASDLQILATAFLRSYPNGPVSPPGTIRFGRACIVKVDPA
ncbi:SGNH/GDSL hydrolase family protein [Sphingomonas sp. CGMCC 1.13654]|uniref:SGNH/GDSL hydrolase family protein n=1 Tax=Sphingomonas chungangi TaxID=2683589 RepID=A0A838LB95_9SPHN|nr:SGNH/GDSL hydrolase family protein [Sphingomonas chungangi]MVW55355.1 hypothetical protein [Sphingomonas chungangi]